MQWIITQDFTGAVKTAVGMGEVSRQAKAAIGAMPVKALQPFVEGYAHRLAYEFRVLDGYHKPQFQGACENPHNHHIMSAFAPLDYGMQMCGSYHLEIRPKNSMNWAIFITKKTA